MGKENKTQYNFRMTTEEKKLLHQLASESGRTVSGYIRAKLFGGEKATINAVEFLKEYKAQIHEMQKIGNNINQLTHYANICINSGKLSEAVVQEMNEKLGELIHCERSIESLEKKIIR
jgi:predicted DNA-binding protein